MACGISYAIIPIAGLYTAMIYFVRLEKGRFATPIALEDKVDTGAEEG